MEGEETALYELVTQNKQWILTKQVVRYPYGIHDLFYGFYDHPPCNSSLSLGMTSLPLSIAT
jgi:hypothetical protein